MRLIVYVIGSLTKADHGVAKALPTTADLLIIRLDLSLQELNGVQVES